MNEITCIKIWNKENKANDRILKLGKIWVFYRRKHTDSKRALKKSWISLVIREIQCDKLQWNTWDIMSIQSLTHKCSQQPQTENNLHVHRKWMNKQTVIYPYIYIYIINGKLFCQKKNEILPFATIWMDLKVILQSEIREINTVSFYLYVESKKQNKWANITEKQTCCCCC